MEDKLQKVSFLGRYLAASRTVEEVLEMAMIISQNVLGYDHAIVRMIEHNNLKTVKWIGFPREAADMVIKLGEGISGAVAVEGEPILVPDTAEDSRFLKGVDNCRSELCVPLVYNGKVVGIINIESETPHFFSQQDQSILETFASQITAAVEATKLREELLRVEKLSIVGEFASLILHDIRNDIQRLYMCSDQIASGVPDNPKFLELSNYVQSSAENIYNQIEEVFDFVKTGSSELAIEPNELIHVFEQVELQLNLIVPNKVKVYFECPENIVLNMDKRKIIRVLLNLSKNALEAMPKGGKLRLSVNVSDGVTLISVEDSGVGILSEHIEKIWEPLFTHGKARGTGFGMAIVKKIITEHGWTISVISKKLVGTVFTIRIPPVL
jgi:signal transduction histidine kinase